MSIKIFVGHMVPGTTNEQLLDLFSPYGTITECVALGIGNYGFVHMENESDAACAIKELHLTNFNGSKITVEKSTVKTQGRITKGGSNATDMSYFGVQKSKKIPKRNTTKIFVGNIAPNVTSDDVRALFEEYGEVSEADCYRGFGFVHMTDHSAALQAIGDLHHFVLHGSALTVELSTKETQGRWEMIPKRNTIKLFVGNIPKIVVNDELRSLFEQFGTVSEADCCGGFGFVHMTDKSEALQAVEKLNGYVLHGATLKVELSTTATQGRMSELVPAVRDHNVSRGRGMRRGAGFGMGSRSRYDPYGGLSIGETDDFYEPTFPRPMRGFGPSRGGWGRMPGPLYAPPGMYAPESVSAPPKPFSSDSFARDLLKLYTQDPVAFDHFAKNPLVRREFQIDDEPEPSGSSASALEAAHGQNFEMTGFARSSQPMNPAAYGEQMRASGFNPILSSMGLRPVPSSASYSRMLPPQVRASNLYTSFQ